MAGASNSPHNPDSRRFGDHSWLRCSRCGMGYAPRAYAASEGHRLHPGDPDPDLSWNPSLDTPCGGTLRCACPPSSTDRGGGLPPL